MENPQTREGGQMTQASLDRYDADIIEHVWGDGMQHMEYCEICGRLAVGDTLHLREIRPGTFSEAPNGQMVQCYTNRTVDVRVTHIISHVDFPEGIPEGYCVLSIEVMA